MENSSRATKAETIRRLMKAESEAVAKNTQGFNTGRYESVGRLGNYESLKAEARSIKEEAIDRLPELIDAVREQIEARGGTVYLAEDAADANQYIADVAAGADRLVKSKSMTSEEIEVNEHLQAAGIEVVETDLGEWVLQVAKETPSHIVAPAIHKSREAIADLFNRRFNPDTRLETAEELTRFARKQLGRLIQGADVGMTGANFITADTGTLALVTSEGNARKTALVPPTHVAVAGIEKLIPTVEVELIGRSGTGQDITAYVSLLTPPVPSPVPDFDQPDQPMTPSDRSFHLVLLDNGRTAMREDPQLKETLYCIRCGACSNVCANFQQVGGHAFGGETYSGGIATGWEAGVQGLDSAASFNDLCTGCSRCVNACPVNIDIPWINVVVRDRINQGTDAGRFESLVDGLLPNAEPESVRFSRWAIAHFDTLARWGARTAPLSNWMVRVPGVRWLVEHTVGIDQRRDLPEFQLPTLQTWHYRRSGRRVPPDPDVVLFPDTYTNYVWTGRGKAAIRVLEALGLTVAIAPVSDSGRPALSQGMIATATEAAEAAAETLEEYLEAGCEIVFVEPTDLAMVKTEYGKLLSEDKADRLAAASRDVMSVVQEHLDAHVRPPLVLGEGRKVVYHSHCQQRTLGLDAPTVDVLERLEYEVRTTTAECCGMAGSFGYKTDYYELSMQVGQSLRDEIVSMNGTEASPPLIASGVSCREQLESLFDERVHHPIEQIAPPVGADADRGPC
jgi:iron-sulfur cluster protein